MTISRRVNWFPRAYSSRASQIAWRFAVSFLTFYLACAAVAIEPSGTANPPISQVKLSRPFFNPSLKQKVRISFEVGRPGTLDLRILDRDGFVVRTLASARACATGHVSLDWDGRDDLGSVVADEAYSLKIDLRSDGGTSFYFPASVALKETNAKTTSYDRQQGTLGYQLAGPARVHLQAGSSHVDPRTKEWVGPCLKTIVNREPRIAGSVIEHWDGYDESGTIYVPDLPNFAVSLFATALPENAIITIGNRHISFLEQASARSGKPLLAARSAKGERHEGLNSFEDTAPRLAVRPDRAKWSVDQRLWSFSGRRVDIEVSLNGPSARIFEREPGEVMVFLDDRLLHTVEARPGPLILSVRIPEGLARAHRLTVNWVSAYGPVAANSIVLSRGRTARAPSRASSTAEVESRALPPQSGGQP